MADVLNLNRARKRRARVEKATRAEANRQKHGRTGIEKQAAKRSKADLDRALDGARLAGCEPDGRSGGDGDDAPGTREDDHDEPPDPGESPPMSC